jgi:hypothetical protein
MICEKCKNNFEVRAEKNITYTGIYYHHNPPTFMFEKNEEWEGEIIPLCRKNHRELHDCLIEIMFKHSTLFKRNKSENWLWLHTLGNERINCRDEVFEFTDKWLEVKDDTNTRTT